MFRRWKTRVAPQLDPYIQRRYEDMAVCIQVDIASNRGLLCHYTPWLDQIMEKFDLPEEYRLRHSLVATDAHGRHIGRSGAVQNTLVYYNPVPPEQNEILRSQSREAKRKSILSERFRDNEVYIKRSRSLGERSHPSVAMKVHPAKTVRSYSSDCSSIKVKQCESTTQERVTSDENSTAVKSPLTCHSHIHHMPSGRTGHTSEADTKVTQSALAVSDSRPQSADSYYLRIDEAFRKHREQSSQVAWDKDAELEGAGDLIITESVESLGMKENRTSMLDERTSSSHAVEVDHNNQSTTTRKSKFCTIL